VPFSSKNQNSNTVENRLVLQSIMESIKPVRIIPTLYVADGQVTTADSRHVKDYTQGLAQAIAHQQDGADEVIVMDVTSISERRRNLPRFIKDLGSNLNIPFVFGGGVNTVKDVAELIKWGAQRVYVNSAAVRNPELIHKVTEEFGADSLLVAVDTRLTFGSWKVYLGGGKSRTEIDLMNWIKVIELRGAREVLVSAISRGDKEIVFSIFEQIRAHTSLPLLASTGFTETSDYIRLHADTKVDGLVSAHFFQTKAAIDAVKAPSF
jgi:cyclase